MEFTSLWRPCSAQVIFKDSGGLFFYHYIMCIKSLTINGSLQHNSHVILLLAHYDRSRNNDPLNSGVLLKRINYYTVFDYIRNCRIRSDFSVRPSVPVF